jgi:hypothetical protein
MTGADHVMPPSADVALATTLRPFEMFQAIEIA